MAASLMAVVHIGGSVAGVLLLSALLNRIDSWSYGRNRTRTLEEASTRLGVAAEELDKGELKPELLQFFAERFSGELPGNRISDVLGVIRGYWTLLGFLLQGVVLSGVTWYTCTSSLKGAVHAWWMVAISLVFGLANIVLLLACHLLTERYPGQASHARKAIAQIRESLQVADAACARREQHERLSAQMERSDREDGSEARDVGNGLYGPHGSV